MTFSGDYVRLDLIEVCDNSEFLIFNNKGVKRERLLVNILYGFATSYKTSTINAKTIR